MTTTKEASVKEIVAVMNNREYRSDDGGTYTQVGADFTVEFESEPPAEADDDGGRAEGETIEFKMVYDAAGRVRPQDVVISTNGPNREDGEIKIARRQARPGRNDDEIEFKLNEDDFSDDENQTFVTEVNEISEREYAVLGGGRLRNSKKFKRIKKKHTKRKKKRQPKRKKKSKRSYKRKSKTRRRR
jgi:hypothetical protein